MVPGTGTLPNISSKIRPVLVWISPPMGMEVGDLRRRAPIEGTPVGCSHRE